MLLSLPISPYEVIQLIKNYYDENLDEQVS